MRTLEPETGPLGPKKTVLIIATVVGCIGILWPKVFHPMLIGGNATAGGVENHLPPGLLKERGPGCCDVVLDSELPPRYMNSSASVDAKRFRESLHILINRDQSIRQERPLHMRPEPTMHPAMRERGYPSGPTSTRTFVEGRPGPIPGMRPPMGGGAFQQATPPKGSMGLIMPLYTLGIIAFFLYTILKIVFKKNPDPSQSFVAPITSPAQARKSTAGLVETSKEKLIKRPESGASNSKLDCATAASSLAEDGQGSVIRVNISTEDNKDHVAGGVVDNNCDDVSHRLRSSANGPLLINGRDSVVASFESDDLLNIEELKRKLEATETAMTKIIARMSQIVPKTQDTEKSKEEQSQKTDDQKTVQILGMEVTSSFEGGQKKWDPKSPLISSNKSSTAERDFIETVTPQEIYLEGTLPHESQILVSDSEQHVEEEANGEDGDDCPSIILSSKMTLSLVNLDKDHKTSSDGKTPSLDKTKGSVTELVQNGGESETLK